MFSLCHLAFYLLLFLSLTIYQSTSFSFNYIFSDPTFDRSNIRLEGDAFFDGDVINLSRRNADGNFDKSEGRATYKHPILLWDPSNGKVANFTTSFTFALHNTDIEKPGDGMTFFLVPYPSHLTDRSPQGCLGVFENCYSPRVPTKNRVVVVEFDSCENDWDPSGSHVGINVNSASSVVYKNITLIGTSTDLRITSNITYDSGTKLLSVLVYSDNNAAFGNYLLSANVDLRVLLPPEVAIGFSGATRHVRFVELHQIFNWHFNSTLEPKKISSLWSLGNNLKVLIVLVTCWMAMVGFGSIIWWKKNKIRSCREVEMDESVYEELVKQAGPRIFRYDELCIATKNFSKEQEIGEGAFGCVYIGFLRCLKIHVAIKKLGKTYEQGIKEFTAEVGIISRLRHRNLVELVGCCHHEKELLLVYEYMANGSFDAHLYPRDSGTAPTLPWSLRYKIALGLGSAISYLHRDWNQCVVHRDIKPSNIMLDSNFNAKLGDFGLARLIDHRLARLIAPECFYTGQTSKESDIYSFGIVLLEIACGRIPTGARPGIPESTQKRLVQWVWELHGQSRILEAADDRLEGNFEAAQMECVMVVGLWCAHPDDSQRPNIKKAFDVLSFESPLPFLPPEMPVPTYGALLHNVFITSQTHSAGTFECQVTSHSGGSSSTRSTIVRKPSFGIFDGSMSA